MAAAAAAAAAARALVLAAVWLVACGVLQGVDASTATVAVVPLSYPDGEAVADGRFGAAPDGQGVPPIVTPPVPEGVKRTPHEIRERMQNQSLVFTLQIIAADRSWSLQRLLTSLEAAHYDGDVVHLEIIVDHPANNKLRKDTRDVATKFEWIHGRKTLRFREVKAGLRLQWFEIWFPTSKKEVGIMFEDDVEAAPSFYQFAKLAAKKYYTEQFDTRCAGICLHPSYIYGLRELGTPFYKSASPCAWGVMFFPTVWREFVDYVDERIDTPFEPVFEDKFSNFTDLTNGWLRGKRDVWTPWWMKFIYDKDKYIVKYAFHGTTKAFTRNWQEKGANFQTAQGTNLELIDDEPYNVFDEFPPLSTLKEFRRG